MIDNGDDVIHAEILFEHQVIEDTSYKEMREHLLYIQHLIELNTPVKKIKKYINGLHLTKETKDTLQKMVNEQASNILEEDVEVNIGKMVFGVWALLEILEKREFSAKARATNFMRKAIDLNKEGKPTADLVEREIKNYMAEMESFYRDNTKYAREEAYNTVDKKLSTQVRGWISVAVLDNRTSAVCAGLHNKLYLKKDYPTRFDIPNPPPRHPNCYDKYTQVYTKKGFVYFKDVSVGDMCLSFNPATREMEYVRVAGTIKKHEEKILEIKSKTIDMAVSRSHPFIGFKRDWKDRKKKIFVKYDNIEDIPKSEFKFYVGAEYTKERKSVKIGDINIDESVYAKFMAVYLSDGHYSKTSKHIIISRKRDRDKIIEILKAIDSNVKVWKEKISIHSEDIHTHVSSLGKSSETKDIPIEVMNMSREGINDFLDTYLISDGYIAKDKQHFIGYTSKGQKTIFTTSKSMGDKFVELALKAGYSASVIEQKPRTTTKKDGSKIIGRHTLYRVSLLSEQYRNFDACTIKEVEYNDYVYDVELEKNHTLLTKRNGKTVWGSNCRSILLTVWEGTRITDYKGQKLETWLKQNPKQAEGMLGKKKYKIFQSGKAKIDKYIDLKGHRFYTNEEIISRLGIKSDVRLRKINGE